MTRAGIYLRISSDPQGLRAGVDRQREDCVKLCAERSWDIVGVFEDNDTSSYVEKRRDGYEGLLGALKSGAVDQVVAWHPDRIHRSPKELETFIDVIDALGAGVTTVMAGDIDLATASGRMTARVVGAVARHESEQKSERVRRAVQQAAAQGRPNGGGRAFGYESDGLTVVPDEAALIQEAARALIRGRSCRSVAREWNAAGVLTPRGGEWVPQVVRRLLLSPRLRGWREHRGEIVAKATWPAILDAETGAAVEAVLRDPARARNGGINVRKNPLAGLMFCGRCGHRLFSGVTNGKPSMQCKADQEPGSCGRLTVVLGPLTDLMGEITIERLMLAPKTLAAAGSLSSTPNTTAADTIAECRIRMAELEDMFAEGEVTREQFKRLKSKLEVRQAEAMAQVATATSLDVLRDVPTTRKALEAAWNDGDIEYRRSLMVAVFERVVVLPAEHQGARFSRDRVAPVFRDWAVPQ